MEAIIFIFQFVILFLSIMVHEISHGSVALALGDTTAKDMGRLTFNPIKHFDLWGTFLLPMLMLFATQGRAFIGWAKPVPFNPYNLKNPRRDTGLIGLAGPVSNLVIACFFGGLIRLLPHFGIIDFGSSVISIFYLIVYLNLMLAIFNLIPVPPLDGSKILYAILPKAADKFIAVMERYGIFFLLIIVFWGAPYLSYAIDFLAKIIIGQ
ncbi:MAG TPA: site-2 protease family protein [Candidatus Paceibacterota bacterium]|nr:site-2 protease family protein [Candidatus Paceibacterota bacterium]HPT40368.1 site-2 protease family protein [Candidatus Paceibacterota bacterium]